MLESTKKLFNGSKSQLLIYNSQCHKSDISLFINEQPIPLVEEAKHLGQTFNSRLNNHGYINGKNIINSFNKCVSVLMAKFGHVNSTVLCKIFQQYCCSLYGVLLCSLDGRHVDMLMIYSLNGEKL